MPNGEDFRGGRDLLRPSSETKCIDKWQKPSLNRNCLPICKQKRHTKHITQPFTLNLRDKTHKTTQGTLSLPHHSKELGAGRCHANLVTTRHRDSLPMTRVQVSSSHATDYLWFVKGKSGHKSMQWSNGKVIKVLFPMKNL